MATQPQLTVLSDLRNDPRIEAVRRVLGVEASLHFVGGTVRDVLLGDTVSDLDLATALPPQTGLKRFEAAGIRVIPTGLSHQTITAVPVPAQPAVEITTFRGAGMSPEPGVVVSKTIEEDLAFRDFTVNAIAYDLERQQLIDPLNGVADLEARVIKAVADPAERFREDPLRVLRMVRIACQKCFTIDLATAKAAEEFVPLLASVSVERVREELNKIVLSPEPDRGFRVLSEIGALEVILDEVARFVDFEQNRYHRLDLFEHSLEVLKNLRADLTLRWAGLLHDVGKPDTLSIDEKGERHFFKHERVGADISDAILSRLKFPSKQKAEIVTLVQTHMRPLDVGAGGMRRLLRDVDDLLPQWRELKIADINACKQEAYNLEEELKNFDKRLDEVLKGPPVSPLKSLAINGQDLIGLGVPEGPKIGKVLRALHEKVLDDPSLNEKSQLLKLAEAEAD